MKNIKHTWHMLGIILLLALPASAKHVFFDIHGVLINTKVFSEDTCRKLQFLVDRVMHDPSLREEDAEAVQCLITYYSHPKCLLQVLRNCFKLMHDVCPICGLDTMCSCISNVPHIIIAWNFGDITEENIEDFLNSYFSQLEQLQFSDSSVVRWFLRASPVKKLLIKILCHYFCHLDYYKDLAQLNEHGVTLLKAIAANPQNHVYIFSNAPQGCFELYLEKFPDVFGLFNPHDVIISGTVKIMKPQREFFDYALHTYHLKPEDCLLIDDAADIVAAATECGFAGFLFRRDTQEAVAERLSVFDDVLTAEQRTDFFNSFCRTVEDENCDEATRSSDISVAGQELQNPITDNSGAAPCNSRPNTVVRRKRCCRICTMM
jgi:HAD superfamily hydrolase (TIGR01509 family)